MPSWPGYRLNTKSAWLKLTGNYRKPAKPKRRYITMSRWRLCWPTSKPLPARLNQINSNSNPIKDRKPMKPTQPEKQKLSKEQMKRNLHYVAERQYEAKRMQAMRKFSQVKPNPPAFPVTPKSAPGPDQRGDEQGPQAEGETTA